MKFAQRSLLIFAGILTVTTGLTGCRMRANLEVYEGNTLSLKRESGKAFQLNPGEMKINIKDEHLVLIQGGSRLKLEIPSSLKKSLYRNIDTKIKAEEIKQDFDLLFSQNVTESREIRVSKEPCNCHPRHGRPGPRHGCSGRREIRDSVLVQNDDYRFDVLKIGSETIVARISGNMKKDGPSTRISQSYCRPYY